MHERITWCSKDDIWGFAAWTRLLTDSGLRHALSPGTLKAVIPIEFKRTLTDGTWHLVVPKALQSFFYRRVSAVPRATNSMTSEVKQDAPQSARKVFVAKIFQDGSQLAEKLPLVPTTEAARYQDSWDTSPN